MPRLHDDDVALVRERVSIEDVVGAHVTLRGAGAGTLKGLCPFHDEKTPSFTVAPARQVYFCHGCQAGGDAIKFLMDLEHASFAEAVERLAGQAGVQLRYIETGPGRPAPPQGQRQRLVAAHASAAVFYAEQLRTPDAREAKVFLAQRGFGRDAAERYGCGFAPHSWDLLVKHLRQAGFTAAELITAGLARESKRGLMDRFRRRLLWPIRDAGGDVVGFGARRLFDADDGPKYLNTPETPIYKKSHVLYGLDHARREIARQHRVVVVEGYTDVMACHEAGISVAVATCGTAFGADHIHALRRILLDTDGVPGEIIYTFDGDAAGQKAALRAFQEDQRFVGRTFIAVSPDGMDPCELRLQRGDLAVQHLIAGREPLVDFALRRLIAGYDLDTADGRVDAMRAAAPLIAQVKDREKQPEYARQLAGKIGLDVEPVWRAVNMAQRSTGTPGRSVPAAESARHRVEREALKLAVQVPAVAGAAFDAVGADQYGDPLHRQVREAIADAGGTSVEAGGPGWIERVRTGCPEPAGQSLVSELAVDPVRTTRPLDPRYVGIVLAGVRHAVVAERLGEHRSLVQRLNPRDNRDEYLLAAGQLFELEKAARLLKEQAIGDV